MPDFNAITVTEIEEVIRIPSPHGRYLSMKERPFWGLSFCESGKIVYTQDGVETVSDPAHAVLLPQGASYTLYGAESGSFPLVNFYCDGDSDGKICAIPLQSPAQYLKRFAQLESLSLANGSRAGCMSLLYDLLGSIAQENAPGQELLAPALTYLQAHFDRPELSNAALAAQVGVSEVYFRRLFRQCYGISPKQYVIRFRLNHAKQLLVGDRISVAETAERCGFSSVYHFCRAFRSSTGMTPTEYRRQSLRRGW